MKETIKNMLNHPIATIFIIGATTRGIANIISAAKGNDIQPMISVTTSETKKD